MPIVLEAINTLRETGLHVVSFFNSKYGTLSTLAKPNQYTSHDGSLAFLGATLAFAAAIIFFSRLTWPANGVLKSTGENSNGATKGGENKKKSLNDKAANDRSKSETNRTQGLSFFSSTGRGPLPMEEQGTDVQSSPPGSPSTPKARPVDANANSSISVPPLANTASVPLMLPTAKSTLSPSTKQSVSSQLMPPPPRPVPQNNRTVSSAPPAPPLRVPSQTTKTASSSLAPPRLPQTSTPNRSASLYASPREGVSSAAPTINSPQAKKITLAPGHSPLDWAHLISNAQSSTLTGFPAGVANSASPHRPLRIAPSILASYNGRKGKPAWAAFNGRVYNITPYLPFHPGGKGELMRAAGKGAKGEAAELFDSVHPWVNLMGMLSRCQVGVLVPGGEGDDIEGMVNALMHGSEMDEPD